MHRARDYYRWDKEWDRKEIRDKGRKEIKVRKGRKGNTDQIIPWNFNGPSLLLGFHFNWISHIRLV
jgi:hypothetical protein